MNKHYPAVVNGIKCCYTIVSDEGPYIFRFKFNQKPSEKWCTYFRNFDDVDVIFSRYNSENGEWFTIDVIVGRNFIERYGYCEPTLLRLVSLGIVFFCDLPS